MAGLVLPYVGTHPVTQGFLGTFYDPKTGIGEPVGYVAPNRLYGQRSYRTGWTKYPHVHLAQDVGMAIGTDLIAPAPGKIVAEGTYWSTGEHYCMILFHRDATYQTLAFFTHIKDGGLLFPVGKHLTLRQHFAESGASGHVTGPHLHWEVRRGPANADPHYSGSWLKFDPKACMVGGAYASASWMVPNV